MQRHGIKVWIDEAQIKVGDSLLKKISDGLLDSTHLAVVLSPASVASPWVQPELEIATIQELKNKHLAVLPILYRDCDMPVFLQGKLYADFRNRRMYERAFARLLEALLPSGVVQIILDTVRNAAWAEFESYLRLPTVSSSHLSRWFTNGSGNRRIVHLLKRHTKRGWVINNRGNPSTFEMLAVRFQGFDGDRAIVTTEEYWYLRWYEPRSGKYRFIYNEKNEQTYILRSIRRGWKVDVNIYPGIELIGWLPTGRQPLEVIAPFCGPTRPPNSDDDN